MRILLVQRYFWPDVGVAASVLRAIAERLVQDGHQVTVLSAMPSYNDVFGGELPPRREILDGYEVIRTRPPREGKQSLLRRIPGMVGFTGSVAAHLAAHGRRYDVVFTSSTPPVMLTAAVRWLTRVLRRPYVYHCQDVSPEAALVAGVVRPGWRSKVGAHMDRANVRRAAAVVVLSGDMARTLQDRGLDGQNLHVINNFFVNYGGAQVEELTPALRKPAGVYRVLFAGNLGLLQGLEGIVDAARLLAGDGGIQFAFVGSGAGKETLRERAGAMLGSSVVLFPHQPLPTVLRMTEEADLGLITLARDVYRVAYPSKTMAYLHAGCPVLAVVEPESELARFVTEDGVGTTCRPGDPAALAEAVRLARQHGPLDGARRARLRAVGESRFGRSQALDRWSALFGSLSR